MIPGLFDAEQRDVPIAHDEMAKTLVFDALQMLVEEGRASWRSNVNNELELQLLSGEMFVLGDAGVTRVCPSAAVACQRVVVPPQ
ncbi:MAG: hypothetical protein EXQ53_06745 [Acidobacteria bacterium]|nr:hypothetical protein [Acidobacteriota bacterium]